MLTFKLKKQCANDSTALLDICITSSYAGNKEQNHALHFKLIAGCKLLFLPVQFIRMTNNARTPIDLHV